MKVKKQFYCIQTKINYNVGDEYNGTRTDLGSFLEKETKELKTEIKKSTKKRKK